MMANAAVDPPRPFLRARASTRRALLDAARRIAVRAGVEAVSLGSVADEAGFARTTAYANFCSRDELLQAVVADDLSVLLRAMRATMGLPEPPANPLPPTRVVRMEFQRAEPVSNPIAADRDSPADETSVVQLRFFRPPSNDRFDDTHQVSEWDRLDTQNVDSIEPFAAESEDVSHSAALRPEADSASAGRLEQKLIVLERGLASLGSPAAAPATDMSSFSKRLEAFEKKHEQTVLEMMAEIRAIAQKLEERHSAELPQSVLLLDQQDELPEVSTPSEPPPEAFAVAATEITDSADGSEPQLGWTIRFSTDYLSRARRAAVTTSPPIKLVVTEASRPGARTRRIAMALAAGAIALGSTAIALRTYSTHLPAHATGAVVTRNAAGAHKSVKHVSHADGPVDRLSMKAESGEPDAELAIGLKYLNGDGATKNDAVGAGWIARSALKGNTLAQYWLATLYEHGRGVVTDPVQAFAWYEKAALGGNRKAMHNLAVAYAQGSGVAKDMSEAARWFSRAASLGYVDSAFNLAVLYERGDGVPQSLIDAYKWYAIAAGQGDSESKLRMSAIESELSPEALAAAQKAAAAFKVVPDAAQPQPAIPPR